MSGISGQVCLRRGETLAAGCCWIYDNEIDWADDTCEDGGLVEVLDSRMRYQGTGFFNRRSKITVRLTSAARPSTAPSGSAASVRHGKTGRHWAFRMHAASFSASRMACPA